jgi:hypothetical protein
LAFDFLTNLFGFILTIIIKLFNIQYASNKHVLDPCLDSPELSFETIEYPDQKDRALYEGSTKAGVPWGIGILSMKNGDKYIGCFKNDLYNGFGKLKFSKNNTNDHNIFIGEFKNGKMQGKGKLEWKTGLVFDGEFKDDLRNGFGRQLWANGNNHEGNYIDGKRSGNGTFTWLDGDKYIGNFENDKANGNGTYLYNPTTSALKYEGGFKDWNIHGYGIKYWRNGERYEGDWENDLQHGFGTQFSANQSIIYRGEWKNGIKVN